ncbi:TPA_asm: protein 3 [Guizotia virus 1]|uniref:Protein 3 n=1 Tax=Guizotia virus 1 TaxID=2977969 RepID=A0A9N6YJA6_9RHAB|nr:TPA_asm: protein 3 [Guizotia virus 1]
MDSLQHFLYMFYNAILFVGENAKWIELQEFRRRCIRQTRFYLTTKAQTQCCLYHNQIDKKLIKCISVSDLLSQIAPYQLHLDVITFISLDNSLGSCKSLSTTASDGYESDNFHTTKKRHRTQEPLPSSYQMQLVESYASRLNIIRDLDLYCCWTCCKQILFSGDNILDMIESLLKKRSTHATTEVYDCFDPPKRVFNVFTQADMFVYTESANIIADNPSKKHKKNILIGSNKTYSDRSVALDSFNTDTSIGSDEGHSDTESF